jgi:aspartate/methionine/tyrosine aminotransferase
MTARTARKGMVDFIKSNYNVDLNFNTEVSCSIGSKEADYALCPCFLNEGDQVLTPTRLSHPYLSVTNFIGAVRLHMI